LRIDDACNLILRNIEVELTELLAAYDDSLSRWPDTWIKESRLRQSEDPPIRRKQSLVYYLPFGQKIELLRNFENELSKDVKGSAFLDLRNNLLSQVNLRNRLAHPRGSSEDEFRFVFELAQELERKGCVDGRISEALRDCKDLYDAGAVGDFSFESPVLHNLPFRDYEDTGLIGRADEVTKVLTLLKSSSPMNSYIWLTGFGGMGKTAIAREVCHRLVSEVQPHFDVILWLSFKEVELTTHGVSQITTRIGSLSEIIEILPMSSGLPATDLNSCFKDFEGISTLIVLDNCETFPGQLDELANSDPPISVKFLLTSREVGPFGKRVEVGDLSFSDARTFLGRLVKTYPSTEIENIQRDSARFETFVNKVGTSPLALKWIALSCEKGIPLEDVLSQRHEDYVEYCVASVYIKLSSRAKEVLLLLTLASRSMSVADITMHAKLEPEKTFSAIYELSRSSLIEGEVKSSDSSPLTYRVSELARRYVNKSQENLDLRREYLSRIRTYDREASRLRIADSNRYNKYRVDGSEIEIAVSAELQRILLIRSPSAREDCEREARALCESAPTFWEAKRVLAEIISWEAGREQEAVKLMAEAHQLCPRERLGSMARMDFFLGQKMNRSGMSGATEYFKRAFDADPCFTTTKGFAQSLMYEGDLDGAISILSILDPNTLTQKLRFEFFRLRLEIYKRSVEPGQIVDTRSARLLCLEALEFWYHSVELRWDAPDAMKPDLMEVLVDILDVFCDLSLRFRTDISIAEVKDVLVKFDAAFSLFGFPSWLVKRLGQGHRHRGLDLLMGSSEMNDDPRLGMLFARAGRLTVTKDRKLGRMKSIRMDKGYAFAEVEVNGLLVDHFFHVSFMERPSEFSLLTPHDSVVSGVSRETEPGRFQFHRVQLEDGP
jgi:hypothetical protein